ncbi:unnamed protein product [Toxocara canis]|uniref:Secreted protein n=1 Tax=Toxocara canis TaxID=6265 RepID=A0A3P7F5H0_TOXCA|nr:unnamed protein product [Toxocara canis]
MNHAKSYRLNLFTLICLAIIRFQQSAGLPTSGLLDDATFHEMLKPRCGSVIVRQRRSKRFGSLLFYFSATSVSNDNSNCCSFIPPQSATVLLRQIFHVQQQSVSNCLYFIPSTTAVPHGTRALVFHRNRNVRRGTPIPPITIALSFAYATPLDDSFTCYSVHSLHPHAHYTGGTESQFVHNESCTFCIWCG